MTDKAILEAVKEQLKEDCEMNKILMNYDIYFYAKRLLKTINILQERKGKLNYD